MKILIYRTFIRFKVYFRIVNLFNVHCSLQAGYYIPDAKVVRENYRVQTPAVEDLEPFGEYISSDCQLYDTYRLVHEDEPYGTYYKHFIYQLSCNKKLLFLAFLFPIQFVLT